MAASLDTITLLAASEPSKTPFYIAGGLLAVWAVVVSVIGITRPDFPKGRNPARLVMGLSVLLVLLATGTAVATSSKKHEEGEPQSKGAGEAKAPPAQGQAGGAGGGGQRTQTPGQTDQQLPAAAGGTLRLAADPTGQLAFLQKSATVKAGEVTVAFTNRSPLPHDVVIAKGGKEVGKTATITASTTQARVRLSPGSYVYYCGVDGHRQAGMEGQLTVQ